MTNAHADVARAARAPILLAANAPINDTFRRARQWFE
jgi:hypothetical protein